MKTPFIIVAVFALAFLATALLDLDWVARHWARQALVILLVVLILFGGAWVLKTALFPRGNEPEN